MWALILAGGFGTRLQSALPDRPKALAPVGDRCFLDYQIEYVQGQGIGTVVFCTGFMADQITSYVGTGERFGIKVYYAEESKPLGTAGAIRNAYEQYDLPKMFVVLNGDTYVNWNCSAMRHAFVDSDLDLAMTVVRATDPAKGSVRMNADGQIMHFVEKQTSAKALYANAGVYLIQRDIVEMWPPGPLSLEYDCLPDLVNRGRACGIVNNHPLFDIGTPEGLREFEKAMFISKEKE